MFEEPNEDVTERPSNPADREKEKSDELRMHAELFAVFEGHRKFDSELLKALDSQVARDVQRTIGRLEKSKSPDSPVLPSVAPGRSQCDAATTAATSAGPALRAAGS